MQPEDQQSLRGERKDMEETQCRAGGGTGWVEGHTWGQVSFAKEGWCAL